MMKIAYVSQYDARNLKAWSGTGYNMAKCLIDAGLDLALVGPLRNQHNPINIARYLIHTKIGRKNDHPQRDPGFLRHFARQAETGIQHGRADLVFAPGGLALSHLQTNLPVVLWTDCTFANLLDYYSKFSNLSARSIRNGHDAERRALHNCEMILFSSQWAADSAIRDYGVNPARIHIVPFGSNIATEHTSTEIERYIAQRQATLDKKVILFGSGVDWIRKGFDFATEVVGRLNARGISADLHVAGTSPGQAVPDYVHLRGFIDKTKSDGMATLAALNETAHFFILPSRAECTAIVLCEAASFGLPSLTRRTGGTESVVSDGINGQTFPADASPQQWADKIAQIVRDPVHYADLCRSSFREYQLRLNWAQSGKTVKRLLEDVVSGRFAQHPLRSVA